MKKFILFILLSLPLFAQTKVDASFPFSIGWTDTISARLSRVDTFANTASGSLAMFKRKIPGTRVSTFTDTIKIWWAVSFQSIDDTLEVSTDPTFTAEACTIYPNTSFTLGPYNVLSKKNAYVRPKPNSYGTGTYSFYMFGW